jgi:uncharacterized phage-associated protein
VVEIKDIIALAGYVKQKYRDDKKREISPLKLQKSLYFLFAYWGGFITKNKKIKTIEEKKPNSIKIELDYSKHSEYLYETEIQAWVYGPVLPKVYRKEDIDSHYNANNFVTDDADVKEFIDDLLGQIFDVSDFRLVDISHADNIWKKYFNPNEECHNNIMPSDEIINEYASKI